MSRFCPILGVMSENQLTADLDDLDRIKFKNEIDRARAKNDSEAWAHLVNLYFQRYPTELTRLRRIDREKLGLKGP